MKKLEFTPSDFQGTYYSHQPEILKEYAARANARLAEMKKEMQVFYGFCGDDGIWYLSTSPEGGDTHKLTVFEIEPIEKKCVEHEPDETTGKFYGVKNWVPLMCKHCGVKLKAKWSMADE